MFICFIVLSNSSSLSQLTSNQDGPERADDNEAELGADGRNFALMPVWKHLKEAQSFLENSWCCSGEWFSGKELEQS